MQEYFCDALPVIGQEYILNSSQAHHARDVLHLHHETVRLVFQGKAWFGKCYAADKKMVVFVEEEDPLSRELPVRTILAMALIRREKFELVLQKATELGIKEIIPLHTSRCVVHPVKERSEKQYRRWQEILQSAAEQCKRDQIPLLRETMELKELLHVSADQKYAAYENAGEKASYLSELLETGKSQLIVIGPEGGFQDTEIALLKEAGYHPVTLGRRILRAETAALYACSIFSEFFEREQRS